MPVHRAITSSTSSLVTSTEKKVSSSVLISYFSRCSSFAAARFHASTACFHDGSPIELLPIRVPQVFFTGRMFDGHAGPYEEKARRAGDAVEPKVYPDADHIAFIDPESALWPAILASAKTLLGR